MAEPSPPPVRVPRLHRPAAPATGADMVRRGSQVVGRIKGALLLFTLLVLVAAAFFIAPIMRAIATEHSIPLSGIERLFVTRTWLVIPLCSPCLVACGLLIAGSKRPFLWMSLASVLALLPLGFLLIGSVGVVAGLYQSALGG